MSGKALPSVYDLHVPPPQAFAALAADVSSYVAVSLRPFFATEDLIMHSAPGTWIPVETEPFHPALTSPTLLPAVSQSVDAHQILAGVIGQLRRQIDAKRLDLNLQLIARGY